MERPALPIRQSARLLIFNPAGDVFLFKYRTKRVTPRLASQGIHHFWATPGGALDPGESFEQAAARELFEETGWRTPIRPEAVHTREFKMQFEADWVWAVERYFVTEAPVSAINTAGFTALEQETMADHAWWSADALRQTQDLVFPQELADLVTRLTAPTAP